MKALSSLQLTLNVYKTRPVVFQSTQSNVHMGLTAAGGHTQRLKRLN